MKKPANFMSLSDKEITPYWPTLSDKERMRWAVSAALRELVQTDADFREQITRGITTS